MEAFYFNEIKEELCTSSPEVEPGKMMSSDAILYRKKVFAFLSRKGSMVFKLGKGYQPSKGDAPINTFSPFKSKAPMRGWFEVSFENKHIWYSMAIEALEKAKA